MAKISAKSGAGDGAAIGIDDIRAAAETIAGTIPPTPLVHAQVLSQQTGCEIWLKLENLCFTGSFKDRGALVKLMSLSKAERRAGVIAMSAGNHAQGVAFNARHLSIPAAIVMPKGTPFNKIRGTETLGAEVILAGESLAEAAEHAEKLQKERGLTFVHPYDDAKIIAGQGTIALEIIEREPGIDQIVVPVGGGGLISGIAIAAKAIAPGIEIIGAETELYPSMYQALRGEAPTSGGQTIADGIAVKYPGQLTRAIVEALVDDILLVGEAEIEHSVQRFIEIEKTVVEGAGAVGLA
ncbi:MAG: pyridoxal-phosphate dependent enzyme, partial [Alphaproteobacteria bacterium]